jgi:hypothetical protein
MFDVESDPDEKRPLDARTQTGEAAASRQKLEASLAKYAGARPGAIAAQGEPKRKRGEEE